MLVFLHSGALLHAVGALSLPLPTDSLSLLVLIVQYLWDCDMHDILSFQTENSRRVNLQHQCEHDCKSLTKSCWNRTTLTN